MANNTYVYSGMDRKLTIGPSGTVNINYDEDEINASIKTILATVVGERVRSPLGSRLIELLFEPIDDFTSDQIKDELYETIRRYEPRVNVRNISLMGYPDRNYYDFILNYEIAGLLGRYNFETKLKSFGA